MAHLQGSDYVGSMVVVEDGLPNKREYRRFKIKDVPGNDDYAAMEEVLTRRLTAYLDERDRPLTELGQRPGRFSYPPQLLLVDGGKGQLARRRASGAQARAVRRDPDRVVGQALRGGVHAGPQRAGRGAPRQSRPCSCCSASATRPTASPTPSTASCGASG